MIERAFPSRVPNYVMRRFWEKNPVYPVQMLYAMLELGVKETHPTPNPRITEYFKDCGFDTLNQNHSWCGAFLVSCFKRAQVAGLYAQHLRILCNSQKWLNFANEPTIPMPGDVVIFTSKKDEDFGHVGFYVRETEKAVLVLGGNQKNEVNYTWFAKNGKTQYLSGYRRVV